jgi:uncharacterized protein YkwD
MRIIIVSLITIMILSLINASEARDSRSEFIGLINDHRTSIGLKPLVHDESLGSIALRHSQNMASKRIPFGHSGFSRRCASARNILGGNFCSENVAMGQKSAKAAFDSWMSSPGHRKNIESSRPTHTGFGFSQNSKGRFYWTQIFLEL